MRFGEMWARVGPLAHTLQNMGIGKGETLALVVPNCPEYVVTFLAAAAAGATITTVNSNFNAGEYQTIISAKVNN